MPHPSNRGTGPDDLAKRVARHLADTQPGLRRLTLRDSVIVARLVSGVIVVMAAGVLLLVVFGGVNWLLGRSAPSPAAEAVVDLSSYFGGGTDSSVATLLAGDEIAGVGITATTFAVPLAPEEPVISGPFPSFPPPTTTTTVAPAVTTTVAATTSSSGGTTPSSGPVTSPPTTASTTSTTSTVPTTTSSSTTTTTTSPTTTTVPTTTTTVPETTTTTIPTTTTAPTTTTTVPTTSTT